MIFSSSRVDLVVKLKKGKMSQKNRLDMID